jgi:hypothetical protein
VVNHFKIAKKMVKEVLLYGAPDFRKSMFSEGLEASLVWSSVQSGCENDSACGTLSGMILTVEN